jgi:hypothetical protein
LKARAEATVICLDEPYLREDRKAYDVACVLFDHTGKESLDQPVMRFCVDIQRASQGTSVHGRSMSRLTRIRLES